MAKKILLICFLSVHMSAIFITNVLSLKEFTKKDVLEQLSEPGREVVLLMKKIIPNETNIVISRMLHAYGFFSGITSYGFFSPNVPTSTAVLFEITKKEGSKELSGPMLNSRQGLKRFASNIDSFKGVEMEKMEDLIAHCWAVRMLELNPNSKKISVIFGQHYLPSMKEYTSGKETSFEETLRFDFEMDNN